MQLRSLRQFIYHTGHQAESSPDIASLDILPTWKDWQERVSQGLLRERVDRELDANVGVPTECGVESKRKAVGTRNAPDRHAEYLL